MVKKLIVLCLLSGCAQTPIVEIVPDKNQKEWNDKYNPTDWRKQFEKCKAIFYVPYPEEIVAEEWSKCINEKNYE